MFHTRRSLHLALAGLCGWTCAAVAQGLPASAGYVANVAGEAFLSHRGHTASAVLGQAIVEGMTLHTGKSGGLAVILDDGTVLSFGPDSEFELERYRFAPASEAFRLEARFNRGTLSLVTGAISRLDPEAISLQTPQGRVRMHAGHALLKVVD